MLLLAILLLLAFIGIFAIAAVIVGARAEKKMNRIFDDEKRE